MVVQANFNPEVGFVRRTDFAMSNLGVRFSPRLRSGPIRRLSWNTNLEYISDAAGDVLEDRSQSAQFGIEFNSSDEVNVSAERSYERLPADFVIAPGVVLPAAGYTTNTVSTSYTWRSSAGFGDACPRRVDRSMAARGRRPATRPPRRFGATSASSRISRLQLVRLPYGDFNAPPVGMRLSVAPPRGSASAC